MAVNNSLATQQPKQESIVSFLSKDAVREQINKVVGEAVSQQFVTAIVSAVQSNPALKKCTNNSILNAALFGETLKLSPLPQFGYYYIIPYENKKAGVTEAQFQMGYKGWIQLASRTGQYRKIVALPIKDGELISYNPLTEDIQIELIDDEVLRESSKTIGYYAMFEYMNGFRKALYWSKEKMLKHADTYSKAFSKEATTGRYPKVSYADYEKGNYDKKDEWLYSSFWYKDFDSMACKTLLRQLLSKWGIMSIEMQNAYKNDMAVLHEDGAEYVDSPEADDRLFDNGEMETIEGEFTELGSNREHEPSYEQTSFVTSEPLFE